MKRGLFILLIIFLIAGLFPVILKAQSTNHLVINEIYYNPVGTESEEEWLELYNPTNSSIDLKYHYLQDLSGKQYFFGSISIPAKDFLVIARDETGFQNLYGFKPDVGDLSLTLNNSSETIGLYDSSKLIDQVSWGSGFGVKEGESLERQPRGKDTDQNTDFIYQTEPSPGLGLFMGPEITSIKPTGNEIELSWNWPETDKSDFERFELYLSQTNSFGTPDKTYLSIPASTLIISNLSPATTYYFKLAIVKKYGNREITSWSEVKTATTDYDTSNQILINELFPAPPAGGSEYIELVNNGNSAANLKGWYLSDLSKDYRFLADVYLPSQSCLAFYNTGISLNNSGDTIRLRYPDHTVANKVVYETSKANQSYSRKGQNFFWTEFLTPNAINRFPTNLILKPIRIRKALRQKPETRVIVKGKVSVPPPLFGKQMIYIQDQTAGIQVYFYYHRWPRLKLGTKVQVIGEISTVRGEKRIKLDSKTDIKRIKEGQLQAKATVWNKLNQQVGRLITLSGTVSSSSGSTFYLTDGQKEIKVYIKSTTNIKKPTTRKGYQATITGVLIKTDTGYKLLPRYLSDLKISAISQITNYGGAVEVAEGSVEGAKNAPTGVLASAPLDFRPQTLQSQTESTSQQQTGTGVAIGGGITLAGFLAFLYRLPLWEFISRLRG